VPQQPLPPSPETVAELKAALRAKEAELETLLDMIPVGIGIADDAECRSIRINRYFADFLGVDKRLNASKTASPTERPTSFEVFDLAGRPIPDQDLPMQVAAREGRQVSDLELEVVRQDGRRVRLLEYASPLFDEHGRSRGSVAAFIDVTHRHEAAERERRHLAEIAHAGRLSTLGEMISGLAHEVNQPIAAARNFARACQQSIAGDAATSGAPLHAWLDKVVEQTERAAQIVSRLLGFVRRDSPRQLYELNDSVLNVLALTAPCLSVEQVAGTVSLRSNLAANLPWIAADRVQIEQVLVNLVRNAIEAASAAHPGRGGEVIVETSLGMQAIRVDVLDNGGGISETVQARLFEPFFTTKPQGVGLGLSISRSIVEAHGGHMWAAPRAGGGSQFGFELPVAPPVRVAPERERA
jgi:signal transduction histidine kinase